MSCFPPARLRKESLGYPSELPLTPYVNIHMHQPLYNKSAPATTPTTPIALPAIIIPPVGFAAAPVELLELPPLPEPPFVAAATWMPKLVAVVVTVVPLAVMVEVTTLVAVVVALQPDHVVQGAEADHVPLVQPTNHKVSN